MSEPVNIEYLTEYLQERRDDVQYRYLLEKVKAAKEQIQRGHIDEAVAGALVSYVQDVFEPATNNTGRAADELAVALDEMREAESPEKAQQDGIDEATKELLKEMEADAIAAANNLQRDS